MEVGALDLHILDVDTNIADDDIIFSESPPSIVDNESIKYLYGCEVDLQDSAMNKMLVVKNPSAKASCGCGTSFAFDESLFRILNGISVCPHNLFRCSKIRY